MNNDYDENDDGQYVDEEDWYNDDFWEGAPSRIYQTSGPMDPEFLRAWRKRMRSIYKPEVMRKLGRDMNNRPLKPQPISDQTLTDPNATNPMSNSKPPSKWGSYHDGFRMREYPEDKSQWTPYQMGKHMGLTNLPPSEYPFDRGDDPAPNSHGINLQGSGLEGDGRWNMQSMIPETQYGYTQIADNGQPMLPPQPPGAPGSNQQEGPEMSGADVPHIITPAEGFDDPKRRANRAYNPNGVEPKDRLDGRDGWIRPFPGLEPGTYKVKDTKDKTYTIGDPKELDNTRITHSPISVNTVVTDLPGYRGSSRNDAYLHAGMDLAGNDLRRVNGEPIKAQAVFDGKIVKVGEQEGKGWGNYVVIQHADGTKVLYAHLENFYKNDKEKEWQPKDIVKAGDMIGIVGKSGTDAKHLHMEAWREDDKGNKTYYDPGAWFSRQGYNWKTKK